MNAHPSALELRHAYAQRPFSVFAVSRRIKLPGECAHYSTIHSAMIFPVRGRARFALGGECLEGRHGVVLHGCPHKDLLFGAVGDEPFEHINVYYEANSDETGDPHHWMMRPFDFVPDNYDELMVRVEALRRSMRPRRSTAASTRLWAPPTYCARCSIPLLARGPTSAWRGPAHTSRRISPSQYAWATWLRAMAWGRSASRTALRRPCRRNGMDWLT